jgi:RNA polymerase sigma-70 factor, ECF subfamily
VSDSELVQRAREGDEDAWAELVRRHHHAVFRAAHAALLRADDAEEAAQDAWIAAWQAIDGFRGQASLRTWLLAIAWRKALDRRRGVVRWLRRLAVPSASAGADVSPVDRLVDERTPRADAALEMRDQQGLVLRGLRGLPVKFRDCLLLAASGEVTYEQIGELLGVPVGTVKWRVSEGRRQLRRRLDGLERREEREP